MTAILGISAFYHDSAAALVVDGRIVAAAQEERFSRVKHDERFPRHAVDYCLAAGGLTGGALDFVGFYDKPLLKFERQMETFLATAPVGFRAFLHAVPPWLREKWHVSRAIRLGLHGAFRKRPIYCAHHESHAASAFFPSPFDKAAILTMDGVGEWATASIGAGRGNRVELTHELRFPHSLGLLYSAFTYFCGFKVNSGEYKLMGLAPYGEPRFAGLMREKLMDLKADGSFRLDLKYFNYCQGLTMTSRAMDRLFGGPPRSAAEPLTQREMDIAASIQQVTEEIMLRMAQHAHERTGLKNLCLAGGVALNCVGNGRILREGPFERVWVQPAAGDAGGAVGAALFIWHQLLDQPRTPDAHDDMVGAFLGPSFGEAEIKGLLDAADAEYQQCESDQALCERVAALLAEQKIVGWFQGRMEFGPRALGARSILADPRNAQMWERINAKIKFRESFRPFAPAVLAERAAEYFELPAAVESPYMAIVAPVRREQRIDRAAATSATGLARLREPRSTVPAVTHVDGSARLQTVDAGRHDRLRLLLERFAARTGCPLLVNTSFNVRGEPIVCTPQEAYHCFLATEMDVLVLERFVLVKRRAGSPADRASHVAQFAMD
ncbi:MAG: carbamoyltransferase [Pirellulales bacterium]